MKLSVQAAPAVTRMPQCHQISQMAATKCALCKPMQRLIRIELTPTLAACSEINDVCLDGELPQGGSSAGITWMGKMSGCVPRQPGLRRCYLR